MGVYNKHRIAPERLPAANTMDLSRTIKGEIKPTGLSFSKVFRENGKESIIMTDQRKTAK